MRKRKVFRRLRYIYLVLSVVCLILAIFFLQKFVTLKDDSSYERPAHYVEEVSHRVLLLCSYDSQYYTYEEQVVGLDEGLCDNGIEYDVMHMDARKFNSPEDLEDYYRFFKARMSKGVNYDGVMAVDDEAIGFLCDVREDLFGNVPLVFIGANDLELAREKAKLPMVTGFYENDYLKETIELSMKILPDRKKYVGIHDNSVAGNCDSEKFSNLAEEYSGYEFSQINVSEYDFDELIAQIDSIPDDSVIIYMTCYKDKDGINHAIYEMNTILKNHTNAPILRCYENGVGDGILGSIGMCFYEQSKAAGELMTQVLEGADIDAVPLNMKTPSVTEFDYTQLQKFGIDEKNLPDDAIIYNKPLTFWKKYAEILPSVGLIMLSLFFIIMAVNAVVYEGNETNKELTESRDQLQKSHEKMRYQAEHDEFLDILNRRSAVNFLKKHTKKDSVYSILMVDIDNFKDVNESYGHQFADEILKHLSYALGMMAEDRNWMLARYGGDEFLIMIPDELVTTGCETVEKIMDIFRTPIKMGEETIVMSCSIGISVSDGVTHPDQHIINAEIAMYEAKFHGRNKAYLYSDEMKKKVREENKVKAKILEALDNDGFYMVYQPQVDTKTKAITGYEALIRMKAEGMYPGLFIPVAEAAGWISRIGRLTTEMVVKQLAKWRDEGHELHPVSINFSSNQINDAGYVDFLKTLLDTYEIPSKYIEIEVTEGLFIERTERAELLFDRFRELGIKLLMDDFGTGYSSLAYLTYIPVDVVKLDKSLVDTYLVDGKESFIRDVIYLVHDLKKKIIIEGVEEKWQYERLREFDADIIQGYYFSKPLMPEEAIRFKA